LFTIPVIVSINVSERIPRITAPAIAPPLLSLTLRAAANNSGMDVGIFPSRYWFTWSIFANRIYVSKEAGIP
jgi:hypothetical protein